VYSLRIYGEISTREFQEIDSPHTGDSHCDEIDTINDSPAHIIVIEDDSDEIKEENFEQLERNDRNIFPFHSPKTETTEILGTQLSSGRKGKVRRTKIAPTRISSSLLKVSSVNKRSARVVTFSRHLHEARHLIDGWTILVNLCPKESPLESKIAFIKELVDDGA
jgi:hypothetical protein